MRNNHLIEAQIKQIEYLKRTLTATESSATKRIIKNDIKLATTQLLKLQVWLLFQDKTEFEAAKAKQAASQDAQEPALQPEDGETISHEEPT